MEIQKQDLLESVWINYSAKRKNFYSSAELMIDGYKITLDNQYFDTIDQAVSSIKQRIIEAVKRFDNSDT